MWFRLMMIAFIFNGLCPFGLRILAGMGLAAHYTPLYLVFWYLAGAIAMLALFSRAPVRPLRSTCSLAPALDCSAHAARPPWGLPYPRVSPATSYSPWPAP